MPLIRMIGFHVVLVIGCLALTGCMVGPNFRSPQVERFKNYTDTKLPKRTLSTPSLKKAGISQQYVPGLDLPGDWWRLFHSKELDELVRRSLENNNDLAAAQAALWQARENYLAQIGLLLWPNFFGQMSAERQRFSVATIGGGNAGPKIFSLYNVSANVSYTLDLFGGSRRLIESYAAQVDYQQYQLIAAYITLTANVMTTALSAAYVQAEIEATTDLYQIQKNNLKVLQSQFRLGGISRASVVTQETLVEQTHALIPPLQNTLGQLKHALAVLVGVPPTCHLPIPRFEKITLPRYLPITVSSTLAKRRPDVQAAEALVHAATAQIGVAIANFFPQITLTGAWGWTSPDIDALFGPSTHTWAMTAGLVQPLFRGGALLAQRRAAIGAYHQAFAQYRTVVLTAFQNVADSLRAIETDARALNYHRKAEIAAREGLRLAEIQYKLGGASYLNLLVAQTQYQQSRINRIRAQGLRYNDTVALYQALGGGWWNFTNYCQGPRCIKMRA